MDIARGTSQALGYAQEMRESSLLELIELLRYQTISANFPKNKIEFDQCTNWLVGKVKEIGFDKAEAKATEGAPVVYADYMRAGENAPTLLIYGHYDVMAADPLSAWISAPFSPEIRDNRIFARGASDDKGQLWAVLQAVKAWIISVGELPVNLKVILDGEEEQLSPSLENFLIKNRELLSCDGILIADMGGLDPMIPLIMYGTRGNLSLEISVSGPKQDLHSGTYGGAIDNPLNVLTRILASLQDGSTREILVPGFYDRVQSLTEREQMLADAVPITDDAGLAITGVPALGGEPDFPLKQRISSRPTFEIHGIVGGYQDEGVKTVIPARASAKISFRLVSNQDPEEIYDQVRTYLQGISPQSVITTIQVLGMASPATVNLDAIVVTAANEAFQRGFDAPPRFVRGGGSLPILTALQKHINPDALLTGFGLPEDNEHSPNESLDLGQFYRGIDTMIHYFGILRSLFEKQEI